MQNLRAQCSREVSFHCLEFLLLPGMLAYSALRLSERDEMSDLDQMLDAYGRRRIQSRRERRLSERVSEGSVRCQGRVL